MLHFFYVSNSCIQLEKVLLEKLYCKLLYGWRFPVVVAHLFMEHVNLISRTYRLMSVWMLQRKGMPWCMITVKQKELALRSNCKVWARCSWCCFVFSFLNESVFIWRLFKLSELKSHPLWLSHYIKFLCMLLSKGWQQPCQLRQATTDNHGMWTSYMCTQIGLQICSCKSASMHEVDDGTCWCHSFPHWHSGISWLNTLIGRANILGSYSHRIKKAIMSQFEHILAAFRRALEGPLRCIYSLLARNLLLKGTLQSVHAMLQHGYLDVYFW